MNAWNLAAILPHKNSREIDDKNILWIQIMTLTFPNRIRSFDTKGKRVRFWGYDSAMEISFFIDSEAIRKLNPQSQNAVEIEAEILKIFDAAWEQICTVAEKVYLQARRGSYTCILSAEDF